MNSVHMTASRIQSRYSLVMLLGVSLHGSKGIKLFCGYFHLSLALSTIVATDPSNSEVGSADIFSIDEPSQDESLETSVAFHEWLFSNGTDAPADKFLPQVSWSKLNPSATCIFEARSEPVIGVGSHGERPKSVEIPCLAAHTAIPQQDIAIDNNVVAPVLFITEDACFPVVLDSVIDVQNASPYSTSQSAKKKVIVVRRGGCAYAVKVKHLISAGASAVVIVEYDSSPLDLMSNPNLGQDKSLSIPVVMISYASKEVLMDLMEEAVNNSNKRTSFERPQPSVTMHATLRVLSSSLDVMRGAQTTRCEHENMGNKIDAISSNSDTSIFQQPSQNQQWPISGIAVTREAIKESCDFVVDGGKRGLMVHAPPRSVYMMRAIAPDIPPFATVAVSHALLDSFFTRILPLLRHPIILVSSDYALTGCSNENRPLCRFVLSKCSGMESALQKLPMRRLAAISASLRREPAIFAIENESDSVRSLLVRRIRSVRCRQLWEIIGVTDSDRSSPMPFQKDHSDMLDHPMIAHWFSDNWSDNKHMKHFKLTQIPIGLSNDCRYPGSPGDQTLLRRIVKTMPTAAQKPLRILVNFHHSFDNFEWEAPISGGRSDRKDALMVLRQKMNVKAGDNNNSALLPVTFTKARETLDECWRNHVNFLFEVSPQGNGLDCHRTWEALLLQTIPIVRTSSLDPLYEGLPVAIVQSWEDITLEHLKLWQRKLVPLFGNEELSSRLALNSWTKRIRLLQLDLNASSRRK